MLVTGVSTRCQLILKVIITTLSNKMVEVGLMEKAEEEKTRTWPYMSKSLTFIELFEGTRDNWE